LPAIVVVLESDALRGEGGQVWHEIGRHLRHLKAIEDEDQYPIHSDLGAEYAEV